jgi:LysR family glycine cleavage system transcriptional activator
VSRLPSLNALRAFEAAARLGSINRAAVELAVTPGAVSHQIKLLEADLGVPLLVKAGRGVAVSPEALGGLAQLTQAFHALTVAVGSLRRAMLRPALVVSVLPSFASTWLLPRLDRYWALAPEVDVRIETKWGLTDFERDGVDLAIRFGAGSYEGLFNRRLLSEGYFPVCSPALLAGPSALARPEDLKRFVLLHVDADYLGSDWPTWRMWLRAAGVEAAVDWRRGPRFEISDLALKAARDGQGVALASSVLAADDLARGRLVRPFPQSVCAPFAYWLVCPEANLARPAVKSFVAWLEQETAAFNATAATPVSA